MRKFVHKVLGFAAIQAAILSVVVMCYRVEPLAYRAATIDKHDLLDRTPGPRIIFVGGSNVALGINSAQFERELGYHPVNMGLHGGLPLSFILGEVQDDVRPGDTVIISCEYNKFADILGRRVALFQILEQRPASIRYFGPYEWKIVGDNALTYLSIVVKSSYARLLGREVKADTGPYRRDSFNAYGDVIVHEDMPARPFPPLAGLGEITLSWMDRAIGELNRFTERCRRRGATVFFSYPPLPEDDFELNRAILRRLDARMRERGVFDILTGPQETTYPHSDFFDSAYHLTYDGKQKRTRLLIGRLLERLAPQHEPSADEAAPPSGTDERLPE